MSISEAAHCTTSVYVFWQTDKHSMNASNFTTSNIYKKYLEWSLLLEKLPRCNYSVCHTISHNAMEQRLVTEITWPAFIMPYPAAPLNVWTNPTWDPHLELTFKPIIVPRTDSSFIATAVTVAYTVVHQQPLPDQYAVRVYWVVWTACGFQNSYRCLCFFVSSLCVLFVDCFLMRWGGGFLLQ